jgi:tetratricopeptide (TPR) repeat protein
MDTNNFDQYSDDQLWAYLKEAENEARVDTLLELSERNLNRGDHAQAASFAEQAAIEAQKFMSNTTVENARYRQGLAFWRADRYDEALSAFQSGIEAYQEPDPKIELSKNQWGIASCYYFQEKYADSAVWAKLSTETALAEEEMSMAGLNKFLEARALYMNNQKDLALVACEEARGYRRVGQELNEVAEIDAYMAQIHAYLGNYSEAASLLRNCLVLSEATSSPKIKYFSYRLGNALIDLGEYQEARIHLERAKDLYQKVDDHSSLADCYFSLSLTYKDDTDLDESLELTRSATSLWDALGDNDSYIKGLQRISILLFSKAEYAQSIEVNRRIMDFCLSIENEPYMVNYGWALLRMVDCYQALQEWTIALESIESTDMFGNSSDHPGTIWFYSLKAKSLFALNRHEEAMGVADTALALTNNDEVSFYTAHLYEIKARVSLEQERPDKERHLAHAIALLLAFGETDTARELSEYFKPDFSPAKVDNILAEEGPDSVKGEDLKSQQQPGFGFSPN